jgi:hypothetical protein
MDQAPDQKMYLHLDRMQAHEEWEWSKEYMGQALKAAVRRLER